MSEQNNRIHQILAHLADAASLAADGVGSVVQAAGNAVEDRYDQVKLNFELGRLQAAQQKLFSSIGHTLFLIKSGQLDGDGEGGAEGTVDELLALCEEKQREIDAISKRLEELSGKVVCPVCGRVCDAKDTYCGTCGTKLPQQQPAAEDAPSEETDA